MEVVIAQVDRGLPCRRRPVLAPSQRLGCCEPGIVSYNLRKAESCFLPVGARRFMLEGLAGVDRFPTPLLFPQGPTCKC